MNVIKNFRALPSKQKVLVSMAILLDGAEAVEVLGQDSAHGAELQEIVLGIMEIPLELRVALMGNYLRETLTQE